MKLWHLSQNANSDWDTFDSCVVVAKSAAAAKMIHPYDAKVVWDGKIWRFRESNYPDSAWATPDKITARYIGQARKGETGVICASFNAG